MSGCLPAPPALGHVHREAPAISYTFRVRYTDGYTAPTVVVDSGEEASANARFHAPLTTSTTQSQYQREISKSLPLYIVVSSKKT